MEKKSIFNRVNTYKNVKKKMNKKVCMGNQNKNVFVL